MLPYLELAATYSVNKKFFRLIAAFTADKSVVHWKLRADFIGPFDGSRTTECYHAAGRKPDTVTADGKYELIESGVYRTVHHCDNWRKGNQLDATCYFIVLFIGSTCFGHYYAHHQELATMMLITTLVVSFLVCCSWRLGVVRLEWCPGCRLELATRTPLQPNYT